MKKIDIYVNKEYVCSTSCRKSLKEAKDKFIANPKWMGLGGIITLDEWKKARKLDFVTITVEWAR